jgi:hypothetical protein
VGIILTCRDVLRQELLGPVSGNNVFLPPAIGTPKSSDKKEGETRVLVVQAEVGPDGEVRYCIIGRNEIRTACGEEMAAVAPLAPQKPDRKPES